MTGYFSKEVSFFDTGEIYKHGVDFYHKRFEHFYFTFRIDATPKYFLIQNASTNSTKSISHSKRTSIKLMLLITAGFCI
jgi:hypothetical protein